jgi:small subunit ribosomal protein S6
MRNYELTFITHPELDKDALSEIIERVQGWVGQGGGKVTKVDMWGKRPLAYPIRKQKEGLYTYMEMEIPTQLASELERNLRFIESVMRFLIIVKEEE